MKVGEEVERKSGRGGRNREKVGEKVQRERESGIVVEREKERGRGCRERKKVGEVERERERKSGREGTETERKWERR